jgi:sulfite exporter TauE/SafE
VIPENMPIEFTAACCSALLFGITTGISQCSTFCAPFVSTHIMGTTEDAAEGFNSFIIFSAGRIFMYAMLGLGIDYMGTLFSGLEKNFKYASVIYAAMLMLIGLLMLVRPVCSCKKSDYKKGCFAFLSGSFLFNPATHMFAMGIVLAIIPCPPMGAMLLYSLKISSIISGSIIMVLFGIGTAISPLVIICILAGWFSGKFKTEVPQYRMMFQRISGLILILLGVFSAKPYL